MTTFPAILLMFLFKKSRRTFLRGNRINTALKQEGKSLELVNLSEENAGMLFSIQSYTNLSLLVCKLTVGAEAKCMFCG